MNLFAVSSLVLFFASLGFGLLVYLGDRKSSVGIWWFFVSLATAGWGLSLFGITSTSHEDTALIWQYSLDVFAIFIPVLYLNFTLSFLKIRNFYARLSSIVAGIGLSLFSFSKLFKVGVMKYLDFYWIDAGSYYFLFPWFFTSLVLISLTIFLKKYQTSEDKIKKQIKFVVIAGAIGFTGGITNFLPQLFNVYPFGNYFVVLYVVLMSYSVLRYKLFNIKVIATQLLIFALWLFILFRTLTSMGVDRAINIGLLLATFVIGILLIKSVGKEVRTREQMEKLAEQLADANAKLRELDRQKSEFVSIASHQLRSPLTAMKGYSSMLLEGSFGKIEDKARMAVDRIFQSSQRLVIIIEDFLNLSRIEQGRMQYTMEKIDLEPLVQGVVQDLQAEISHTKLKLKYESDGNRPYKVKADSGKINQVVTNLIDNSIKYTNEGGVTARLEKSDDGTVTVKITDTGIGIPDSVMPKLFKKFSRSEQAGKENIKGTGLGLYVASEIIKAHGGKIWAESKGRNKGSTFFIEFPPITKP